jgi:hypothetical protein
MNQPVPLWVALIAWACSFCTILVVAVGEYLKIRAIHRTVNRMADNFDKADWF